MIIGLGRAHQVELTLVCVAAMSPPFRLRVIYRRSILLPLIHVCGSVICRLGTAGSMSASPCVTDCGTVIALAMSDVTTHKLV